MRILRPQKSPKMSYYQKRKVDILVIKFDILIVVQKAHIEKRMPDSDLAGPDYL